MSTLIIWVMGAALLLINIMLRTRILRLEARLKELSRPEDYLRFLRQQAVQKEKVPAIKALRKQYPELSLIEANNLWQPIARQPFRFYSLNLAACKKVYKIYIDDNKTP